MSKIFLIGFDKCGTTSFTKLFRSAGINVIQHGGNTVRGNVALIMHRNFTQGKDPLVYLKPYDAFTNIMYADNTVHIWAARLYQYIHRWYSDAYYILNVRPVDKWIESVRQHDGGSLWKRLRSSYATRNLHTTLRSMYYNHIKEVKEYMLNQTNGCKFLIYDIEKDKPRDISIFLYPKWKIDPLKWGHHNRTRPI